MAVYKLTMAEKLIVKEHVSDIPASKLGFIAWPANAPRQWNACTDPCDMWHGPCCCGATHIKGE